MKFERLTPMLWTNDLSGTIDFYSSMLNFELDEYNVDWGWCHMHRNDVNIMFAVPNAHTGFERPLATASFYVYIDEVDELWDLLKDKATVFYPIANFAHNMREFAIKDNNGYILQFGRELQEGEVPGEA